MDSLEASNETQKYKKHVHSLGDENKFFFHTAISRKRKKLQVEGVMFDGIWISNPVHVKEEFQSCPSGSGAGRSVGPRSGNRLARLGRIRVGSWNVGTLTGKRYELVETLRECKVDILCVQETRWKGRGAARINDYKLWFSGSRVARNGVGIIIGPPYNEYVVDVGRRSDRIMSVRLVIQEVTFTVICAYAPHAGRGDAEKRHFWESLDAVVRMCPSDHSLLIGGDLNGHIGSDVEGYAGVHGGFGYGARNEEGLSILEFAVAHDLAVVNSFFKKRDAQLATFHSGGHSTQIDYLLIRKGDLRTCGDCKVLTAWTCSSQHRLLVMDLVLQRRATKSVRQAQPKILWKKLNGEKAETFKTTVIGRVDAELEMISNDDTDQMWNCLASSIREVAKETLGVALGTCRGHRAVRESWWFSEEVQSKVALKKLRFRELIAGGEGTPTDRIRAVERYKEAKREAKKAVALAKENAYEDLYKKLDSKEGANDIYKIAKARERRRMDLDNIKFIKNEDGQTLVKEDEIRKRWEEYFSSLFVVGRPERHEDLQDADIEQSHNSIDCERISEEEVRLALRKMGRNKSVGPDQIPIEAWWCLGDTGVRWLTCLFNKTFRSSKMPMEWRLSETIPIYKNKGDAQCCDPCIDGVSLDMWVSMCMYGFICLVVCIFVCLYVYPYVEWLAMLCFYLYVDIYVYFSFNAALLYSSCAPQYTLRYNAILGRISLQRFGAIPSTVHGLVKFLTKKGIATLESNPPEALCTSVTVKEEEKSMSETSSGCHIVINSSYSDQLRRILLVRHRYDRRSARCCATPA
ncbi:uncharacterized protein [Rutidosis leptorrhynchoides]|uniref:uncharacterized protein n=1 Tax=Rutidosis leptorrhynchoides TaxID=125765 RepID=UPI003A9995CF